MDKPLKIESKFIKNLKGQKYGGLILDDNYENGIAKSIANELNINQANLFIHLV